MHIMCKPYAYKLKNEIISMNKIIENIEKEILS